METEDAMTTFTERLAKLPPRLNRPDQVRGTVYPAAEAEMSGAESLGRQ